MKPLSRLLASALPVLALGLATGAHAAGTLPPLPQQPPLPLPPSMLAPQIGDVRSAVLLDVNSDQVLLSQDGTARVPPSGLAKLMTALLLSQAERQGLLHPAQTVHVTDRAWRTPGSRMFLQPLKPVTVQQLEDGLLIDGGNDAAVAIAQTVGGTVGAFVQQMNADAAQLGLHDTHFVNPTGLPQPGQYSSALDIAKLSRALILSAPQVLTIAGRAGYTYDHIHQYNYNPLIGQGGVNGLAVGLYGKNLWNLAVSATRNGRTLVAVVMGAGSRSAAGSDASALLTYGWNGWKNEMLYGKQRVVAQLRNADWSPEHLDGITAAAVEVSVPVQSGVQTQAHFIATPHLAPPIRAGQPIGVMAITWKGKALRSVPVFAGHAVQRADWFEHLWHQARAAV